ncbi:MAG TPA: phosphatase PAP2 family protein [Candidatus Saccharimonadales bacterium]|nr:phosphatase PAP2 family protein [Candidatus Saccharimonadales bacterium]
MKSKLLAFVARLNASRKENELLFWARVATIVAVIILFIVKRSFWTPDTLFIVLLAMFVVLGQARNFLLRFAPFVLLLLTYDSFRSIADDLNKNVHFWEMIDFDRWMFGGQLPTATLQQWWWHGTLQWYDFYFYFLYTIHFVVPLVLAIVLWKVREHLYWPFVVALVGLSFGAFITYVIFPAAPPWMASDLHFIEPIHRISSDIWRAMGIEDPQGLYAKLSPNAVAAVPSLHSAYPLLFWLFIVKAFGFRRMGWLFVYPLSMWVGVTYMGEHYVFDAILGAIYAIAAYAATMWFFAWARGRDWQFRADYHRGFAWGHAKTRRR